MYSLTSYFYKIPYRLIVSPLILNNEPMQAYVKSWQQQIDPSHILFSRDTHPKALTELKLELAPPPHQNFSSANYSVSLSLLWSNQNTRAHRSAHKFHFSNNLHIYTELHYHSDHRADPLTPCAKAYITQNTSWSFVISRIGIYSLKTFPRKLCAHYTAAVHTIQSNTHTHNT